MQAIKATYVNIVRQLSAGGPLARLGEVAPESAPHGWLRWGGSLLAIHDTGKMIGLDLPWWNVAATREIEAFLSARPGARVFEWGAGASTVWLARRAGSVVSVEHDPDWLAVLQRQTQPFGNVTLLHRERANGAYVDEIACQEGRFDLIVVDGRDRIACLAAARAHLAPGGLIVFDDSGRRRYRNGIRQSGLSERRFFGRSYCVPYPDHTSLLEARD